MATRVSDTYYFRRKGNGGGGGGSSDAVKYTEQTLTEAEQMQARENLDLYRDGFVSREDYGDWNAGSKPSTLMLLQPNDYFIGLEDLTPCFYAGSSGKAGTEPIGQSGMVVDEAYLSEFNGPILSPAQVVEQTDDYIVLKANNHHAVIVWADSAVVSIQGLGTFTIPQGTFVECEIEGIEFAGEEEPIVYYCVSNISIIYHYMAPATIKVPAKYLPITTSLSASSTNNQVPGAKAVYDNLADRYTKAELAAMAETWTFTLEDDSTVTKKIIVLP